MKINQIAFVGDSLTQGLTGNFAYRAGGKGNWFELACDRLAAVPGVGPLVSSGFRACVSGTWQTDWAFSSGWTGTLGTDAWDKAPYGDSAGGSIKCLQYANGSTKIATYTGGADIHYPNVGFAIYWVDYASGSSSTPSYSLDGGSTWIDFPDTPARNNSVRKFYVATPIASGATVQIRGANAAGTGVGVAPLGIEVFYQNPATAQGLICHNLGVWGSQLASLVVATSGDRMAWLDSVVLGTGAITNQPNLGVVAWNINDVQANNVTNWAACLTALYNRVHPLGPLAIISTYEADTSAYTQSVQTSYRASTKATAAGFGTPAKVLDLYDAYTAMGIVGNVQTNAAGFLYDGTHESQAGHIDIAARVYWFVRSNFFDVGAAGNGFLVGSSGLGTPALLGGASNAILTTGAACATAIGSPSIKVKVSCTGKQVACTAGTPTLKATKTIPVTGVACASAVGTASLKSSTTTAVTGKAEATAVGTPTLKATKTIGITGLAAAGAVGTASLKATNRLAPSGIAASITIGSLTIHPGAVALTATGLTATCTAGSATLRPRNTLSPAGKACTVTAGTGTLHSITAILPAGKSVSSTVGTVSVIANRAISLTGVAITSHLGGAVLRVTGAITPTGAVCSTTIGGVSLTARHAISPSGIASSVAVGNSTVRPAPRALTPTGTPCSTTVGGVTLHATRSISLSGANATSTAGASSVRPVPRVFALTGKACTTTAGTATLHARRTFAISGAVVAVTLGTSSIHASRRLIAVTGKSISTLVGVVLLTNSTLQPFPITGILTKRADLHATITKRFDLHGTLIKTGDLHATLSGGNG